MNRAYIPGIIAMAAIVVASNISWSSSCSANWLTWGAFTYPLAFLVTDIMNRMRTAPPPPASVVLAGFRRRRHLCSLIGTQIMGEFGPLVTFRIAVASGVAFLTAQLLDVAIFSALRNGAWWRAPLASTLVSSSVDTILFFSIAFSGALSFIHPATDVSWASEALPLLGFGPVVPLWISLAVADWSVKLLLALTALIPFRAITRHFI